MRGTVQCGRRLWATTQGAWAQPSLSCDSFTVYERERERESLCVCVCVRERESATVTERSRLISYRTGARSLCPSLCPSARCLAVSNAYLRCATPRVVELPLRPSHGVQSPLRVSVAAVARRNQLVLLCHCWQECVPRGKEEWAAAAALTSRPWQQRPLAYRDTDRDGKTEM